MWPGGCQSSLRATRRRPGPLLHRDPREWYENKLPGLERKKRFYHYGVQAPPTSSRSARRALESGPAHHRSMKGLDTSLAVDMVALQDTYDIAPPLGRR